MKPGKLRKLRKLRKPRKPDDVNRNPENVLKRKTLVKDALISITRPLRNSINAKLRSVTNIHTILHHVNTILNSVGFVYTREKLANFHIRS